MVSGSVALVVVVKKNKNPIKIKPKSHIVYRLGCAPFKGEGRVQFPVWETELSELFKN
jgi:hypothetical protein